MASENRHITRTNDTQANVRANLDPAQEAILTDQDEESVYKNAADDKLYYRANQFHWNGAAIVFEDVDFDEITAHSDILVEEYIKRAAGTDDSIRFENDKVTIAAGGVSSGVFEDDRALFPLATRFGDDGSPSDEVELRVDQNGSTVMAVTNDTAGTLALAALNVIANSCGGSLGAYDDGYTSNTELADKVVVITDTSTTAIALVAAAGIVEIYTKGAAGTNKKLSIEDTLALKEVAAANGDVAGVGQFWVKSDAPNTPWFTDDGGTDRQLATVGSTIAEMYMYEAGQTITVAVADVYHAIYGYTTGDVSDWTFQDGRNVDANIANEIDGSPELQIETSVAHNLTTGDIVTHDNMNNAGHNGVTQVTVVDATNYTCDDINYVADSGASAGVVDEPAYLQAGANAGGDYMINYSISGDPVGADTYKFEAFINATENDKTASEHKFAINDLGPAPGTGIFVGVAPGDRIWLGMKNKTGTNNFDITHSNVNLHRV